MLYESSDLQEKKSGNDSWSKTPVDVVQCDKDGNVNGTDDKTDMIN